VSTGSTQGQRSGAMEKRLPAKASRLFVCAECRYAQRFAVQPRALCTRRGAPLEGVVLFAGQPACAQIAPRKSVEPVLACCAPVGEQASRRSALVQTPDA
jgi:hypothetical protein